MAFRETIVLGAASLLTAMASNSALGQVKSPNWNPSTAASVPAAGPPSSPMATSSDISGTWTGSLTSSGDPIDYNWREEFDLTQDGSGNITGTRKSVSQSMPQYSVVWQISGSFQNGIFSYTDQSIQQESQSGYCQTSGQLTLSADAGKLSGPWQGTSCSGGSISVSVLTKPATVSLLRQDITHVLANAAPEAGTFSYSSSTLGGSSVPTLSFAPGTAATDNPSTLLLTDPANPNAMGKPSPGGLAKFTVAFAASGGSAQASFQAPTFGLSCYYTALQSDFGTAPKSCKSIHFHGMTYSGVTTDPPGLPAGSYCTAFLADVQYLQGSGQLDGGQYIQYSDSSFIIESQVVGHDGTPIVAGQTAARSLSIIPSQGVSLDIENVGTNISANDTGSDIQGYRLDLYKGSGKAQCSGFDNVIPVVACSPKQAKCPELAIP